MKKMFCVVLVLLFAFTCSATAETDFAVQMTCIVRLPDVIREGKYTGELENGVPHGYGMFETVNSAGVSWHYIGEWENGNMTGQGGQYWNNGKVVVGTFENGESIVVDVYDMPNEHAWVDYTPNENGHVHIKFFRTDDTLALDALYDPANELFVEGTIYKQNGDVFFSGEFGEGFDFNYLMLP